MRPHVELIHEDDYIWHPAELPVGEGTARQRNLSIDEEDGSSSLRVDFVSDWGRAGGVHHADTEYYVREGELELGDGRRLGPGGYLHVPKGIVAPSIKAKAGTKILHFREYGEAGFDATDRPWDDAYGEVTVHDTEAMDWTAVDTPGPMKGLHIKLLHRDEKTGFYSRLVWAEEGWTDHRLAHHPVYEEAYTIWGRMTYNFGDLDEGTYFFRPAKVKHGHFISEGPRGCAWLLRSDGELINWYTTNERVEVHGDAENYTPAQAPVLTDPVRSRSRGPWDGDGR
jgi:hypothetical protein